MHEALSYSRPYTTSARGLKLLVGLKLLALAALSFSGAVNKLWSAWASKRPLNPKPQSVPPPPPENEWVRAGKIISMLL